MRRTRLIVDDDGWVTSIIVQRVRNDAAPPIPASEVVVDALPEVEMSVLFVHPQTHALSMPHHVEVAFARFKAAGESDEQALAKTLALDFTRLPDLPATVQLTQQGKARVVVDAASQAVKDKLRP